MLTGEPIPAAKVVGDEVIGATMNTTGAFVMRATRVGRDTALAQIVDLVQRAQGSKAPIQRLADRISAIFVPIVLVVATGAFVVWFVFGPEPHLTLALSAFITTVIIACPCAMGLATPTAIMVGTGKGAEAGILIRGGEALEGAHRVDTVIFDKTGTLTLGRPAVAAVHVLPGWERDRLLDLVASLETGSEHPLAAAIVAAARHDELGFRETTSFEAVAGFGVVGRAGGHDLVVGTARLLAERGIAADALADFAVAGAADGKTPVHVAIDGAAAGLIEIADPVKAEATEAVRELTAMGIEAWLVTGDQRQTAEAVARQVGIPSERVLAEVLPGDKAAKVAELQAAGRVVAMVGDGINDAPALARADLGVAIGTGTDVAIEASDVTLVGGDPRLVASAIDLSERTMTVIRQNLFWAFAYNVLLIPVAVGVLYPPFGITVSPALAAGAMALSSVSVVTNSLRLRRLEVRPGSVRVGRRTRVARLRDASFLAVTALLAAGVAGGVLAADRAIEASAQQVTIRASDLRFDPRTSTSAPGSGSRCASSTTTRSSTTGWSKASRTWTRRRDRARRRRSGSSSIRPARTRSCVPSTDTPTPGWWGRWSSTRPSSRAGPAATRRAFVSRPRAGTRCPAAPHRAADDPSDPCARLPSVLRSGFVTGHPVPIPPGPPTVVSCRALSPPPSGGRKGRPTA